MRLLAIIIGFALVAGCSSSQGEMYGDEITTEGAVDLVSFVGEMGDAAELEGKVSAEIAEVCQKKGCWMKVKGPDGENIRVTFKDYGFFVPKDAAGRTIVMDGYAYTDTTSVDDLRHYAEDAGKSEEEIMAITEPEISVSFEAKGVVIQ